MIHGRCICWWSLFMLWNYMYAYIFTKPLFAISHFYEFFFLIIRVTWMCFIFKILSINEFLIIVQQWDLVCSKSYLTELSLTMYMVGATCGTLFLTPLSDRFGRKTVMLGCLWIQSAVGITLTFLQSPIPFIVLQFFIGITNMVRLFSNLKIWW